MTSLEILLKEGTKVLEQHKIQEARLDAWLLLEYVTGMNRAFYFAHSADGMDEEKADRYRELIRKRAAHVPLQHITHQAYFMGFEFYVNQNRTGSEAGYGDIGGEGSGSHEREKDTKDSGYVHRIGVYSFKSSGTYRGCIWCGC